MATQESKYVNEILRPIAEGVLRLAAADGAIRLDHAAMKAAGLLGDSNQVVSDRSDEGLPVIFAGEVDAMHALLTGLRDSLTDQQLALLNRFKVRSLPA